MQDANQVREATEAQETTTAQETAETLKANEAQITGNAQEAKERIIKEAFEDKNSGVIKAAFDRMIKAKKATPHIPALELFEFNTYKALMAGIIVISIFVDKHPGELSQAEEEFIYLAPYLQSELETTPLYSDKTLSALEDITKQSFDEHGNARPSRFDALIERAREKQKEFEAEQKKKSGYLIDVTGNYPQITVRPIDAIKWPLDKVNSLIWHPDRINYKKTITGSDGKSLYIRIGTTKQQEAEILYSISFDELPPGVTITRTLTEYDELVFNIVYSLWAAGNEVTTVTQIYKTMGYNGRPGPKDFQRILNSLNKMAAARITIDNTKEYEATKKDKKGGYKPFKYIGPLLSFEYGPAEINGTYTPDAIFLGESAYFHTKEPVLGGFARIRGQITAFKPELLNSPLNKTSGNLTLENYIRERISHMKNNAKNSPTTTTKNRNFNKILYSTLYKRCGIATPMQKQRTPDKIRKYLDHCIKCGWIKGYKEAADGITITP